MEQLYLNRKKIQSVMGTILDSFLEQADVLESTTVQKLRAEIADRAATERLKIAKVPEKDLKFVRATMQVALDFHADLLKSYEKLSAVSKKEVQHKAIFADLRTIEQTSKMRSAETKFQKFLKAAKILKGNANWKKELEGLVRKEGRKAKSSDETDALQESWSKDLETYKTWYQKYSKYLVVALVQGLDDLELSS